MKYWRSFGLAGALPWSWASHCEVHQGDSRVFPRHRPWATSPEVEMFHCSIAYAARLHEKNMPEQTACDLMKCHDQSLCSASSSSFELLGCSSHVLWVQTTFHKKDLWLECLFKAQGTEKVSHERKSENGSSTSSPGHMETPASASDVANGDSTNTVTF